MKLSKNYRLLPVFALLLFGLGQLVLLNNSLRSYRKNTILQNQLFSQKIAYEVQSQDPSQGMTEVTSALDSLSQNFQNIYVQASPTLNTWVKNNVKSEFLKQIYLHQNILSIIGSRYYERNPSDTLVVRFMIRRIRIRSCIDTTFATILGNNNESYYKVANYSIGTTDFECDFDLELQDIEVTKAAKGSFAYAFVIVLIGLFLLIMVYRLINKNRKETQKLSSLKTDFINNLLHEIRTPIGTITIGAKTLELESVVSNKTMVANIVHTINKQCAYLQKLSNHMTDIRMWERQSFTLTKETIDVVNFTREFVNDVKAGTKEGVEIHFHSNLPTQQLNIDTFHFTTALNNILSNAVKYNPTPLTVQVQIEKKNTSCILSINDNGVGISKTDLPFLFDKFYRNSSGNLHNVKGLGLGLYYSNKIVEAHGGSLTVTSKLGVGTTFFLELKEP